MANQFPVDKKTVAMVDPDKVEEGTVTAGGNSGSDFLKNKKEAKLNMALLGLRITALVMCMKSFVLLAADKQIFRIWQAEFLNESVDLYKDFKYVPLAFFFLPIVMGLYGHEQSVCYFLIPP